MMTDQIQFLEDIDFKDKRVFMRVDFNVPLSGNKVVDSYRIDASIPSIKYILEQGGHLVLGSHLGRPEGKPVPKLSLKPIAEYLNENHNLEVVFLEEVDSEAPLVLLPQLKNNQVVLLENLRFHPGELDRDPNLAKQISEYIDVYINEGFSISHRNHMSTTLLPQMVACRGGGFLLQKELEELDQIRLLSEQPLFVFLGGSKAKDKIPLLDSLMDRADAFFIGGLLAYTFLKARGTPVGYSYVDTSSLHKAEDFMERLEKRGKQLYLPIDHVVAKDLISKEARVTEHDVIDEGYQGLDIGPRTIKLFSEKLLACKSLFWNGPMGKFEQEEFRKGTTQLAEAIASHKQAYRVVGGGHSAMAVRDFSKDIDHISTGGGASLNYLQNNLLPGLESLKPGRPL